MSLPDFRGIVARHKHNLRTCLRIRIAHARLHIASRLVASDKCLVFLRAWSSCLSPFSWLPCARCGIA